MKKMLMSLLCKKLSFNEKVKNLFTYNIFLIQCQYLFVQHYVARGRTQNEKKIMESLLDNREITDC